MNRGAGFSPAQRLRRSHEFLALRRSGKKLHSPHFFIYVGREGGTRNRLGLTVSKKVGSAVERNRVKRLLREFFRRNQTRLHSCIDISIIAKPGAAELTYTEVYEELTSLLFPAGGE